MVHFLPPYHRRTYRIHDDHLSLLSANTWRRLPLASFPHPQPHKDVLLVVVKCGAGGGGESQSIILAHAMPETELGSPCLDSSRCYPLHYLPGHYPLTSFQDNLAISAVLVSFICNTLASGELAPGSAGNKRPVFPTTEAWDLSDGLLSHSVA